MTPKIKSALIIAGLVLAAVISALIVYGNYQRRAYINAMGASDALTAEYEAYKKTADGLMAGLNASINTLAAERDAAIHAADQAQAVAAEYLHDLEVLQGNTAALPPDALSGNLSTYIGVGNIAPTGSGRFSLTRPGAENTLNLFLAGDAYRKSYAAEMMASNNLRTALDASVAETKAWTEKFTIKDNELNKALVAWAADRDALTHLRRSIFGRRVKSFIIGAGVGAAAVIVYSLVRGK
ncbi:MAG: hypothetical protein M0R06_03275 [Sphaerochaeta sp.]|jgi:hypothetical protein|nr:hypothetical protein [Sphaerochaeta sp.]